MPGEASRQMAVLTAIPPGECLTVEILAVRTGLTKRNVSKGAAGLIGARLGRARRGWLLPADEGRRRRTGLKAMT